MRSKEGQHYPDQRVPGNSEVILGPTTAENPEEADVVLTEDGAIAIDGGKLPGNKDDFDGEIDRHNRKVPGATGERHQPEDE
jgi:hypothetical protein